MDNRLQELYSKIADYKNIFLEKEKISEYTIDGKTPVAVIEPEDEKQVSHWLQTAGEQKAYVNLWGAGTHQQIGGLISGHDITLSSKRMDRVVEYEPENLTITVESGMTLETLNHIVSQQNQVLLFDFPGAQKSSIGGLVNTNLNGPFACKMGTIRDHVLGIKAVLPNGKIVHFGGKTVKNVAGYDVSKLFIGSMGTLGMVTEVTFRLDPKPEKLGRVSLKIENMEKLESVFQSVNSLHNSISVFSVSPDDAMELDVFSSDPAGITDLQNNNVNVSNSGSLSVNDYFTRGDTGFKPFVENNKMMVKWIVPLDQVVPLAEYLCNEKKSVSGFTAMQVWFTSGIVWCAVDHTEDDLSFLKKWRDKSRHINGRVLFMNASGSLKQSADVWDGVDSLKEYHNKVKSVFDPNSTLAGGRFLYGI